MAFIFAVLFLADVRLGWNSFRKSITGTVSNRTVITEDPKTPEADVLRIYASTVLIDSAQILDQACRVIDGKFSVNSILVLYI